MNLLKISTYSNVYELAEILFARAKANSLHDLAILKAHTALSRSGEIFDEIDELEQALSRREEVEMEQSSDIIFRIADLDDKICVNSTSRTKKTSIALLLEELPKNSNRKRFQDAEDYIKKFVQGEENPTDKYVEYLIDVFNAEIRIEDVPYKRKLSARNISSFF